MRMLVPGIRVVRGPDWSWGNQDGGEGFVGAVSQCGGSDNTGCPDKTVLVQWDNGTRTNYSVGHMGKFDLRIIDNAQIGVRHSNVICGSCKCRGIYGIRYKCNACFDYDLCFKCYHGAEHALDHHFKRYDSAISQGVDLPSRNNARRLEIKGIFAKAKVVRGYNWKWGNQDGGEGQVGLVIDIRDWNNETKGSVANVKWLKSGASNLYRIGHRGECDIKFVEPSSGGFYYPDHLPVLNQDSDTLLISQDALRALHILHIVFNVGQKVQVTVTEKKLRTLQQGHGGWNPKIAEYIGKTGRVHRVTDKGDVRVQYDGCRNRWTFNPLALAKVNSIAVGDVVFLCKDIANMKILQRGHGEWTDAMMEVLGKLGKVLKVYTDGDLRVEIGGQEWTLNPECVRVVPDSIAELANTVDQQRQPCHDPSLREFQLPLPRVPAEESTLLIATSNTGQIDGFAPWNDEFVRAAAQGNLNAVKKLFLFLNYHLHYGVSGRVPAENVIPTLSTAIVENLTSYVNGRSGGRTALQVAAHQGHLDVVIFLINVGASVNARDADGDTCLHYAASGNQADVVMPLIEARADLNAVNQSGRTALHIAVHKPRQSRSCVEIFLQVGSDPNCMDLYGNTPLHDAIEYDNFHAIESLSSAPRIDLMLRNNRGFNALHHAASKGKVHAVEILVSRARQLVNVKMDDGFAALHLAAFYGHRDVVEALISKGNADVNLRNNRQQTALLLAVSQMHYCLIELLVNSGADINARDENNENALHLVLAKWDSYSDELKCSPSHCPMIERSLNKWHDFIPRRRLHHISVGIPSDSESQLHLLALAISSLLMMWGIDNNVVNSKGQLALQCLPDNKYQDMLREFVSQHIRHRNNTSSEVSEHSSPMQIELNVTSNVSKEDSNIAKGGDTIPRGEECFVCSEINECNIVLQPCLHRIACEECSARIKKCPNCGQLVTERVTIDGRVVPALSKGCQPSIEHLRYLEQKIAEIEESSTCTICTERKRNVVFLCGHGACTECSNALTTCHMCRENISRKIVVY